MGVSDQTRTKLARTGGLYALGAGVLAIVAIIAAGSRNSVADHEALSALFLSHPARAGEAKPPTFRGNLQEFRAHPQPQNIPGMQFEELDGAPRALSDFRGKVVLLNYWATWCGPCVEEMPALERLQARLGGAEFTVLAVSVDRQGVEVVKPFVDRLGLKQLPIVLDRRGVSMHDVGIRGLPTTLLIDREGREIGRIEGAAAWDSRQAEALIRFYLAANPIDPAVSPTKGASGS